MKVDLSHGRKFLIDNKDYFKNVNTTPLVKRSLVGGYNGKALMTVFNESDEILLNLYVEKPIKELKKKITYLRWNGGTVHQQLIKYKCGTYRPYHGNTPNFLLRKSPIMFCVPYSLNWSTYIDINNCSLTLEEYMDEYSKNVRGEHYTELDFNEVNTFNFNSDWGDECD
jgi:hypothetical protein